MKKETNAQKYYHPDDRLEIFKNEEAGASGRGAWRIPSLLFQQLVNQSS